MVDKASMRLIKSAGIAFLTINSLAIVAFASDNKGDSEWPAYGRDPGGQRYSPLASINRQNVQSLKVAWTFRTGDAYQPKHGRPTAFEATPLYVDGTLYLGTPLGRIIALDPVSGKQPRIDKDRGYGDFANRGVSIWRSPSGQCRIFIATIHRLPRQSLPHGQATPLVRKPASRVLNYLPTGNGPQFVENPQDRLPFSDSTEEKLKRLLTSRDDIVFFFMLPRIGTLLLINRIFFLIIGKYFG